MSKQEMRLPGIDFLRFICAFFVVCAHEQFAWKAYIAPFVHVAIPVFFMISGYFYVDVLEHKKLSSTIYKLFSLLIKAYFVYLVWDFCFNFWRMDLPLQKDMIYQYTTARLSFILHDRQGWLNFLIFNTPPFGSDHLWYLPAIFCVYLIISFLKRVLHWGNCIYYLIPALFALQCLMLLGVIGSAAQLRNFLYPGIPCFLMGDFVRKNVVLFSRRLSTKVGNILLLLFCTLLWLLPIWFSKNPIVRDTLVELSLLGTAFLLILLAVRDFPFFEGSLAKRLACWGRKYSANIYIYHFLISRILSVVVSDFSVNRPAASQIYSWLAPAVVFFSSLLLSMLFDRLQRVLRKKAVPLA